ncbi:ankyrin repeat domain-containing protein 50 [Lingula anatina]|uniref:Ankyrin repeat domain-containing protein 50 n=1 Tax=Lingula anatina TaxID=7574 RepID=A0A1S3I1L4_LINAN|nr:ankyrin repeat domain-containing protein 50 [Lingula anatina]|eukprot:XP_013391239.1 ankyrin repeat domain-containing protein 50 [Lingula anatina]
MVKLLLDSGAEVNAGNRYGRTPLHEAAQAGHKDMVELLLERGADPNITNEDGSTPLHLAACKGHEDNVKLLLDHGADPNITDKYGWAPLHWAAEKGHEDITKLFLERGADSNITSEDDRIPLQEAAGKGFGDIAKLLLERGADPNIREKDKLTPYASVVKRNQRFSSPSIQTHLLQKVITAVSEQVSVRDIRFLARKQLGIPNSKLENIRCQNPNDAREEAFQILWEWMKIKAGATVHNLFKALKDQQLNEGLDKVRDEYAALLNEIWAMPEDEFQKFHSSLQPTKSSIDDVTLSNMTEMNLRCYFSDDLESLYVPVESSNANAKGNDNDSHKVVLKYRFAGKGVYWNAATSAKKNE